MNMPSNKNRVIRCVYPVLFGAVFLFLAGWLFKLQIFQHDKYESLALDQQTWEIRVDPKRGSIKDVNGVELAVSATAYQVLMAPVLLETEEECFQVATFLADVFLPPFVIF